MGKKTAVNLKGGETLALTGELGSGKTTFIQGLAEGFGIKGRIISPTFILMRKYVASKFDFYHIDFYRLEDGLENEVKNLGVDDTWGKNDNVVAIEWAEKIENALPQEVIWIRFENLGEDKRKILIEGI
ncbi:tRNA (adenosine(37)-N6)-threonylcarbamoyltransferase complex ATPase subunit type 1 TsaE [Patescibacteria group bacterium]|nr:tRNA (adenosine(37)-N6)-threonylcarbamoyltransferase complex ATPase subunit type 1 TsaE [Patescibacteria group bacterium]MBU0846304.1 tRNA (adenosine(37)-N6)-threonylcarbamoyltransferase complex ATPase subunit type 1 TsaE [Patescibacteria group bacterium]MBU1845120.1 tRNA (adenosine(37)-N6)-threonylcarbamoyltransferase complex ATPase subunit type 1 TsaE [Patescibacteria group bacterium]